MRPPSQIWTFPVLRAFQKGLERSSVQFLRLIQRLVDKELGLRYRPWALRQIYGMGGGELFDVYAGATFLEAAGWTDIPRVLFEYRGEAWKSVEPRIRKVLALWQSRVVLDEFREACREHMAFWGGATLPRVMAEVYHTANGIYLTGALRNAVAALRVTYKRDKWTNS